MGIGEANCCHGHSHSEPSQLPRDRCKIPASTIDTYKSKHYLIIDSVIKERSSMKGKGDARGRVQ
jgi:hypothetical protein